MNKEELKTACPEAVRRWYRAIGSKGGQAGKGTEERKRLSRQNAKKRWDKVRANGGENWAALKKPKTKPKKKRPQAKPPKRKKVSISIPSGSLLNPDTMRRHGIQAPTIGFK